MKKKCIVCGQLFEPNWPTRKICSPECVREQKNRQRNKWRAENLTFQAERYKKPQPDPDQKPREPKPDTIIAVGYADRQIAKTLSMVPKIDTKL